MRYSYLEDTDPFIVEALRKRGVNEPCWCKSDIKYKKCHLHKENKRALKFKEGLNRKQPFFSVKECMHPIKSDCSGSIIKAHTIQRNGSLKTIINANNKVLSLIKAVYNQKDGEPDEIG